MDTEENGTKMILSAEEAGAISMEVVDSAIHKARCELDAIAEEWEAVKRIIAANWRVNVRQTKRPIERSKSKMWWCVRILGELEDRGLARRHIRFSGHAAISLMAAQWIWDRVAEYGEIIEE